MNNIRLEDWTRFEVPSPKAIAEVTGEDAGAETQKMSSEQKVNRARLPSYRCHH